MSRINLLLLVAVLVSGMVLIRSAYDSRRLFTEVDRARAEAQRLESDHQRLLAERHAQATNLRVEQVARERLHMRVINPAVTQGVDLVRPQAASGVAR
ncbi:MAG: cell division protein FtsL [Roseateles asaccharophilus]|uniref:Cell division protein FtsL n=1 Tax=Roseateles asaccharophilus TaxID=582607 RepID=A0A4R6N8D3_9BURK|nr:cell division protein FtsL [Roseateles asaccharophilus]MDN3545250.1 cell division protein FtsL [Roseateles asaccharophilus]TDP11364.1 cell division protein FtsL [Roseateles asaccharophilus]